MSSMLSMSFISFMAAAAPRHRGDRHGAFRTPPELTRNPMKFRLFGLPQSSPELPRTSRKTFYKNKDEI